MCLYIKIILVLTLSTADFFLNLTKTNLFFDNLLQRRNNVVFLQYINVSTKICSSLNNQNNIGWVCFLFWPYDHFCWGNTKIVSYFPYDEDLFWSRLINEKWSFIIYFLFLSIDLFLLQWKMANSNSSFCIFLKT